MANGENQPELQVIGWILLLGLRYLERRHIVPKL